MEFASRPLYHRILNEAGKMDQSRAIDPQRRYSPRFLLLLSCAALSVTANYPAAARTLPNGGHYVAGAGGIVTSGATTTITQSSKRGIIDWKSFSIGKGDAVQFDNGAGATLNKVTGGNLSTIAGQLKATGSVYLINQSGVVIGPGGKVVTGRTFVASTRDTGNGQFMAGGAESFNGSSNGTVVNDGAVVSQAGSVVLVGHAVTSNGTIDAAKGTAALIAGNHILMTEASGPAGVYVAADKSGDATNDGQVRAAAVELASAGGNVYALAGNRSGLIQATGTKTVDGQVWLTAPGGGVDVAGQVVARDADGSGGAIRAKGASLAIADGTVLNAAGKTGRGRIVTSGDRVSIGKAKVTAGTKGKWTIDPTDLTIDGAAASTIDNALNAGTDVTEQTTATTASGSGSTSGGSGDIDVAAALTWSSSATLTLSAFNNIIVGAPITVGGGGTLVLTYDNNQGGASAGGALGFVIGQGSVRFTTQADNPALYINDGTPLGGNGTQYTLIYDTGAGAAGLQSLNGASGNFALAAPLDATSLGTLGNALIPNFSGTFNGLGNTVSNLTIVGGSACFAGSCGGLFGTIGSGGVVTNLGLVGGSVTVAGAIGELAGINSGTISNSYATGSVIGGPDGEVGGLVGFNLGTISRSYATGAVTNAGPAGTLGGLVGQNNGTIADTYATGSVIGGANSAAGGLVGEQGTPAASIASSYATGQTVGGNFGVGGLVGLNAGSITNAYYDSTTTGLAHGTQGDGSVGLTTAELSAGLPAGFSSATWANAGNKTTPFLGSDPGPVYVGGDSFMSVLVFTPAQLQAIGGDLSGNYALAQNIDMSGIAGFVPIGGPATSYTGTFDGLGNRISNLTIVTGADRAGLFGEVGVTGVVENIGLLGGGVTDTASSAVVGGLVANNRGTIANAYTTGTVTGGAFGNDVGGLVGLNDGSIADSYATGAISGGLNSGGLSGANDGAIASSYASGTVFCVTDANVGGLVGMNFATGTITDAYASGAVTDSGNANVGGLVGSNVAASISSAYAVGAVTGGANSLIGGLVGTNGAAGMVTLGYATGQVASTGPGSSIGGLVGNNLVAGAISNSAWNVSRAGVSSAAGTNAGTLTAVAGLSGSAAFDASSYAAVGFAFTAMPGMTGNAWVMVDKDGTLNGTNGGTMPMLAFEYSTSIINAHQLQLMAMDTTANYALALNIDASATKVASLTTGTDVWGTTGFAPVGPYTGRFDGAGRAISGLTIDNSGATNVGLFSTLGFGGVIQNVALSGGSITGGNLVGALVGLNAAGTVLNVVSGAAVTGTNQVGGLVGGNDATITNSQASGTVAGLDSVGGLAGENIVGATISNSDATGAVTGTGNKVGGLVGIDSGAIAGSHAIGAVVSTGTSAFVGGLVGQLSTLGTIASSFATGAVTGAGASDIAGGLVGESEIGSTITDSHATGSVSKGVAEISAAGGLVGDNFGALANVYAAGTINSGAAAAGGLVGLNSAGGTIDGAFAAGSVSASGALYGAGLAGYNAGSISNAYAVGSVTTNGTANTGGLVGKNDATGTLSNVFATGAVQNAGGAVGGLVATNAGAAVSNGYWDIGTTGQQGSAGGMGMTTAALQAGLPGGFSSAAWGIIAGESYPYLKFLFSGTPQVIAGTVYTDGGATNAGAGITVNAMANGATVSSVLTIGAVTTGANGYYYYLEAPGTLPANANLVTYAQNYGSGGAISGVAATDQSDGYPLRLDILGNTLHVETQSGSWNAAESNITIADGGTPTAIALIAGLSNLRVDAFNAGAFVIDGAMAASGNIVVNAAGNLAIDLGSVTAGGSATLATAQNFDNQSGAGAITVGAGQRWLVYSTNPNSDTDGGLAANFIQLNATHPTNGDITSPLNYGPGTAALGSGNGFLYSVSGALTLTGITKTYDGTTHLIGVGGTTFTLGGAVAGDTITFGGSLVGSFAGRDAGGGIDVTESGLTVTATRGGVTVLGYSLGAVSNDPIGTIAKATLTATLAGTVTKTYDGTDVATLSAGNLTLSGLVSGDSVSVAAGSANYASPDVGTGIAVDASGYTLSGADASNYVLAATSGSATIGDITRKALTVSLTGTVSKTYDGTTSATLAAGNYSLAGIVSGDTVSLSGFTTGTYDTANAGGGKLVSVTGLGLTGVDAGNYSILGAASGAVGKIGREALTAALTGTIAKTYDGTTAALLTAGDFTLTGFVSGQGATVTQTAGTYASADAGGGIAVTASLSPGRFDADSGTLLSNYILPVSAAGTGKIGKASLIVTANGDTVTYDGTAFSGGNGVTYGGFVDGETAAVLGGTLAFVGSSQGAVDAGKYRIKPQGLTSGNYDIAYRGGRLTIDPKTLTASLTGTVDKTYDGTTAAALTGAGYELSGVVAGDTVALNDPTTGRYDTANAGSGKLVLVTGLGLIGADAGNYRIAGSVSGAVGTIDPKLLVAGLTGMVDKPFDGTKTATLTDANYTLTGLIAGDRVALNDPTAGTYATAAAGSGIAVTVRGLALLGARAGDYRLSKTTLTANVGDIIPPTVTPPPPPPRMAQLPEAPFIPVVPSQPALAVADPLATEAAVAALVVPRPDINEMAKLSGCSGEDFVAVVPERNGHVGAVVVESEGNKTLLHAAYAGCSGSKPVMTNAQEVNTIFGDALAARPAPPASYQFYYKLGSVTLEPNALAAFDKVFAEITRRKAAEVVVAGYTDTVGAAPDNDRLSRERAQNVSKLLVARGLAPMSVTAFGRGERDPEVPTKDQVAEQKNRRVEITVR
jgi:filamentous hemagglutinin family protein